MNIKSKKISKPILLFLIFNFAFLTFALQAKAQSVVRLIAMPPRVEGLSGGPGDVVTTQVKIKNAGSEEIVIKPETVDFIVQDKEGQPVFLSEEVTEHENRWAMSRWMTVSPTQFILNPGETRNLDLLIVIPEDAIAGGRYAAVIYRPDTEAVVGEDSGSQITPSVAALVYLTVEGDINEDARVTRLDVPRFSEFGPIDFQTEISNFSEIHINPKASINVYNLFNQLSTRLNIEEQNIFPGQARIYTNTWDQKWLFGRFKAELTGSYGTQGQTIQAVTYFWVVPWKVILAGLLAITFVTLSAVYLKKKSDTPTTLPEPDLTPEE